MNNMIVTVIIGLTTIIWLYYTNDSVILNETLPRIFVIIIVLYVLGSNIEQSNYNINLIK